MTETTIVQFLRARLNEAEKKAQAVPASTPLPTALGAFTYPSSPPTRYLPRIITQWAILGRNPGATHQHWGENMGRVKARKGETSRARAAHVGEGNAIRALLTDVARGEEDQILLAQCCQLLDRGIDTARFPDPFRLLVLERRRELLGAALIQAGNLGTRPGDHLAELEEHQNLYAQQLGMQRKMFARINAVTAHLAFMAVAPSARGQGIGRQLVRAGADIERKRGRRILTGYVWDDDLAHMYEKWGFIVSPPETATFFLREKIGNMYAPTAGMLSLKEGSRLIVLPLVSEVRAHDMGSEGQPLPAVVGIEEPFDPSHLEIPEELNQMKERIDAFTQQQLALYGPERTRAMFDAYLGRAGDLNA